MRFFPICAIKADSSVEVAQILGGTYRPYITRRFRDVGIVDIPRKRFTSVGDQDDPQASECLRFSHGSVQFVAEDLSVPGREGAEDGEKEHIGIWVRKFPFFTREEFTLSP